MESPPQSDRETYRVIVLGRGGNDLLLARTGDRCVLPTLEIPRFERVAENLTAELRNRWGHEAVCLFNPDGDLAQEPAKGCNYQVMESFRAAAHSNPRTEWVGVDSLSENDFADAADYTMVQRSVIESTGQAHTAQGPFVKLGWFRELQDWIEEAIKPRGLHLTGKFSQLNASPSFSLVRFETTGPAVWFKAVGKPNLHEFSITLALEKLFPQYVPPILAVRPEWNGWLALEVGGTNLADRKNLQYWKQAAKSLAELQIESIGYAGVLVEANVRELPVFALTKLVRPFIDVMGELMEAQTKIPPAVLSHGELLWLGEQIEEALGSVRELHLPDGLGHLDLNPGNIIVSGDRSVFLDWAEAYVGNPFLSFQYLVEHLQRTARTDAVSELELNDSYASPWQAVISPADLSETLALVPLVAAFAYATATDAWRDSAKLEDPKIAGCLRSLTRRMHREASRLQDRSTSCRH